MTIGLILLTLANYSTRFSPLSSYQMPDTSPEPAIQDDGPSADGATTLTITNGIPHQLFFSIQKKQIDIAPCPSCKIYMNSSEIPKDICTFGTKASIDVNPGQNAVHWRYQTANIAQINATWKISPGRKYSTCIVMDRTRGRANWDSQ